MSAATTQTEPGTATPPAVLAFDYDGVIADSLEYFLRAFLGACRHHGYLQLRARNDFLAMFDTNMYDGMVRAGVAPEAVQPILRTMAESLESSEKGYALFDGMGEVLRELSDAAPLYVVTSNVGSVVEAHLRERGLTCFRDILGGDIDTSKSAKIRVLKGRYPQARLFYVGDTVGDMLEAREAGAVPSRSRGGGTAANTSQGPALT